MADELIVTTETTEEQASATAEAAETLEASQVSHTFEEYVEHDEYYCENKRRIDEGQGAKFNWAAFFLPVFWAAYRRMYGLALGMALVGGLIPRAGVASSVAYLAVRLFMGFRGNPMYINKVKDWQDEESKLQGEAKEQFFMKHSGSSALAPFLIVVAGIALGIFTTSVS